MKNVNLCFTHLNHYSEKLYFSHNYVVQYVSLKIICKIFKKLKTLNFMV